MKFKPLQLFPGRGYRPVPGVMSALTVGARDVTPNPKPAPATTPPARAAGALCARIHAPAATANMDPYGRSSASTRQPSGCRDLGELRRRTASSAAAAHSSFRPDRSCHSACSVRSTVGPGPRVIHAYSSRSGAPFSGPATHSALSTMGECGSP